MTKTPFVVFGIFAAVCVLVIPIVALGKEGDSDAGAVQVAAADAEAKQLVAENCGQCHTLAAAGIDGVVGPNLDQLLVTSGTNSAEQYPGLYQRAYKAINCGIQGRMPKGILLGEEAESAAAFVAAYAAQIGEGPTVDIAASTAPDVQPCSSGSSN